MDEIRHLQRLHREVQEKRAELDQIPNEQSDEIQHQRRKCAKQIQMKEFYMGRSLERLNYTIEHRQHRLDRMYERKDGQMAHSVRMLDSELQTPKQRRPKSKRATPGPLQLDLRATPSPLKHESKTEDLCSDDMSWAVERGYDIVDRCEAMDS